MPEDKRAGGDTVNAQGSQGFINYPTGAVTQNFVTINEGASVNEFMEALRNAGILSRLATRLPEEQFRRLLEIVARVTLEDAGKSLYEVCRATLPPTARLVNVEMPSLLLFDMSEQPWSKAWPPLFECIERFALVKGIAAALVGELQRWVEDSVDLVTPPTSVNEIERLRREIRAEAMKLADSETLSWLQVYLEPDWLNRTQDRKQPLFRVELVLWSPRTHSPLVLQTEPVEEEIRKAKNLWMLDELPSLLDQVFGQRETIALIPDMTRLVIEIVAPSDVLLYGFERWKRNDDTVKTYGATHVLVVRLRDRLAIPNPADQKLADDFWHQKWTAFRNSVCLKGCEELVWRKPESLDAYGLQDDSNLVGLGLSSPLLPEQREVFDTLREAGIPIAIWMRGTNLGPAAPADWPEQISAFIRGRPFSSLPEAIKQVRRWKDAQIDPFHFGNALTLLWDDPDRPPLKYQEQGVFV